MLTVPSVMKPSGKRTLHPGMNPGSRKNQRSAVDKNTTSTTPSLHLVNKLLLHLVQHILMTNISIHLPRLNKQFLSLLNYYLRRFLGPTARLTLQTCSRGFTIL